MAVDGVLPRDAKAAFRGWSESRMESGALMAGSARRGDGEGRCVGLVEALSALEA